MKKIDFFPVITSFERKLSKKLWFLSVKLSFERRRIFTCACCLSALQQKWIELLIRKIWEYKLNKKSDPSYLFLTYSNISNIKSWLLIFKLNFDLNKLSEYLKLWYSVKLLHVFTISWLFFCLKFCYPFQPFCYPFDLEFFWVESVQPDRVSFVTKKTCYKILILMKELEEREVKKIKFVIAPLWNP